MRVTSFQVVLEHHSGFRFVPIAGISRETAERLWHSLQRTGWTISIQPAHEEPQATQAACEDAATDNS
jgi:hypothetical protein